MARDMARDARDSRDSENTKASIAEDVKEFGKEAINEADRFEKFLDNLRSFAEHSEEQFSDKRKKGSKKPRNHPRSEDDASGNYNDGRGKNKDGRRKYNDGSGKYNDGEYNDGNGPYTYDSYKGLQGDDAKIDYPESDTGNYKPDPYPYPEPKTYDPPYGAYNGEKEHQSDRENNRGGHRYHKDRRRTRRPSINDDYEKRKYEVTKLIDSEPDETDYLSNSDVVEQLKKSEVKYNTGVDPVYSSQKDFDEVTRLEKMIEKVALSNKQKEQEASQGHDHHESNLESKVSEKKVQTKEMKDNKETKEKKKQ